MEPVWYFASKFVETKYHLLTLRSECAPCSRSPIKSPFIHNTANNCAHPEPLTEDKVEVGRDDEELAHVSPALAGFNSQPRPFYPGGSIWNRKKLQHPSSSQGRRHGLGAHAGRTSLRRRAVAAAALPELRPTGLSSPSPLLPPPLSPRPRETASPERDTPQAQNIKNHLKS